MNDFRNRIQLVGNLGMDPEIKNFDGGKLAKFSLATNSSFKNAKGQVQKETQWHNIIAWGNHAEMAEKHLAKGNHVAMEGKVVYRNYEDRNGNKKYITEIVLSHFVMIPNVEANS